MTLSFPSSSPPGILPREVAEKAPFANLAGVLTAFHIPTGSAVAAQVSDTLCRCQLASPPNVAGEVMTKSCTTSLEATVQSAMRMLGADHAGGVWVASSELTGAGLPRQQYAVVAAAPVVHRRGRYVYCHTMQFPYTVYLCHIAHQAGYRAYKVSLAGLRDGSAVSMLAFCHLNTAGWSPAHPAFEVLHAKPGGAPVCHFMPYGNMVFVKN